MEAMTKMVQKDSSHLVQTFEAFRKTRVAIFKKSVVKLMNIEKRKETAKLAIFVENESISKKTVRHD